MEINQNTFFIVGIICFSIIATANSFYLFIVWENLHILNIISSLANITFNIAMVLFFKYLYHMSNPNIEEDYTSDDVEEIIQKLKEEKKEINEPLRAKEKKRKAGKEIKVFKKN